MKKQNEGATKRIVPAFATEAEEAEWWFQNRDIHSKQLLDAVKTEAAQTLTAGKLRERIALSKQPPLSRCHLIVT